MSNFQAVRYPRRDNDFINDLRKRVNAYFKENEIDKYANTEMKVKTVFMILLYLTPYFLMLFGVVTGAVGTMLMYTLIGLGIAGIGLGIMHDANHGAYSKKQKVNDRIGQVLNFVGGHAVTWKIQHNVLHHSFTNIDGMDEDIDPGPIMRFNPHKKRYGLHRLQHLYGWFIYGLMTFFWLTFKDFLQLARYRKMGLTKQFEGKSIWRLTLDIILWKVFYYGYAMVIPILFFEVEWYWIVAGWFWSLFISGLILGMIFQPAHVVPETVFPMPDADHNMDNNWAIHQMLTTTNFAPKSRIFSWYVGGLNYQVEHHLFPNICHVHYRKLAPIVEACAKEHGVPYYSERTFAGAVIKHIRLLRDLGKYDDLPETSGARITPA